MSKLTTRAALLPLSAACMLLYSGKSNAAAPSATATAVSPDALGATWRRISAGNPEEKPYLGEASLAWAFSLSPPVSRITLVAARPDVEFTDGSCSEAYIDRSKNITSLMFRATGCPLDRAEVESQSDCKPAEAPPGELVAATVHPSYGIWFDASKHVSHIAQCRDGAPPREVASIPFEATVIGAITPPDGASDLVEIYGLFNDRPILVGLRAFQIVK